MAGFAAALPYISAAASVASTVGNAKAQERVAEIEAKQLHAQGIADTASAVQTAKHERKRASLLQSRVKALAAKSGSASSSGDVQKALSDIDEQGEYNALAALYSGYSSAASKGYAASAAKARGKAGVKSGYTKAGSTILSAADKKWG